MVLNQTSQPTSTAAVRQDFYDRIATHSLAPLWEVLKGLTPTEPRPSARPHIWRWQMLRPFLAEAGALVTAEEAERRVLSLINPAFKGPPRATATLFAGIQMVLPGETAGAHRHSPAALRFVLESDGGYTAVSGERTTMRPGDFIITPSWSFHDHGNDGTKPVLWLDVLDVPLVGFLETGFFQPGEANQQASAAPEGHSPARFGASLLPLGAESPHGLTSPVFNYPYERTRAALKTVARGTAPSPYWGVTLRYANPLDGGWAMPTIASWMTYLPAGFSTSPMRSTDGLVVAVAEGSGTAQLGSETIDFQRSDIFVAPNWTWRRFEASEDCFLFISSDRVVQEKLGLWREERAPIEQGS
jgi:gentisate 1,2-dioxygenase